MPSRTRQQRTPRTAQEAARRFTCKEEHEKTLIAALLAAPLLASAQNLVVNGSFIDGTLGQPGSSWTVDEGVHVYSQTQMHYAPPHVGAAFGEDVPADNAVSLSPDAAGEHGVYFVDDTAVQSITSTAFTVATSGLYDFGFSSYAPQNGYTNPGNSSYVARVGNASLAGTIGGLLQTTWQAQHGQVSLVAGNLYNFELTFTGGGGIAKDLVIDRAYVIAAVPEPTTGALLLAGLAGIGFVARRRTGR